VPLKCSAISPGEDLEYAAARSQHPDHKSPLEAARGGTLFLDEVADLSSSAQAKLLTVLQERSIIRGQNEVPLDFRIVSATQRDLQNEIRMGRFREDLYFRLVVFELETPPLRSRGEDIPLLANHFLREFEPPNRIGLKFSPAAMELLRAHQWPGNVRELENAVHRAALNSASTVIAPNDLPPSLRDAVDGRRRDSSASMEGLKVPVGQTLSEIERYVIQQTMLLCNNNRSRVAQRLGIGRTTLYRKLKEYNLELSSS